MTSPPFPTYIVDIAVVMRDSENHHDPAVRHARKTVANALVGLNRELTRVGSPAASTAPDENLASPRRRVQLADHHDELTRRYIAGETTTALAAAFGVSDGSVVASYLRKHGVRMRPRGGGSHARKTTTTTGATA